ncbi:MAG: YncE family protein, partial [Gemmatimonadota bacterium]
MPTLSLRFPIGLFLVLAGCTPAPPGGARDSDPMAGEPPRLPTGVTLDPDGTLHEVGQFPLAMVPSPEGDRLVLLLNGHNDQGLQVVDRATGQVLQPELQPAAFPGLVFSPDGRTLYASGGNQDVVYRYDWSAGRATRRDSVVLAIKAADRDGTRYPAGLATSPDGGYLYVAENLADQVAVVGANDGRVVQRLPAGRYPYGVVVSTDGTVYVSAWGASHVTAYTPASTGGLAVSREIPVGRHPSAMVLNRTGTRLFVVSGSTDRVTVVDT